MVSIVDIAENGKHITRLSGLPELTAEAGLYLRKQLFFCRMAVLWSDKK
jgi:hypothetical protein